MYNIFNEMIIKTNYISKDSALAQLKSSSGVYRCFLFIRFINGFNINKISSAPKLTLSCCGLHSRSGFEVTQKEEKI